MTPSSIRWRLQLITQVPLLLAVILLLPIGAYLDYVSLQNQWVLETDRIHQLLVSDMAMVVYRDGAQEDIFQLKTKLVNLEDVDLLRIVNQAGERFEVLSESTVECSISLEGTDSAEAHFHQGYLHYFGPLILDGVLLGNVEILRATDSLVVSRNRHLMVLALLLIVVFILSWSSAYWAQRIVSRPLVSLAAFAKQVTQTKDFSLRVVEDQPGEIGWLQHGFNAMLHQVQKSSGSLEREVDVRRSLGDRLEEEKERLEGILNAMGEGVVLIDAEGRMAFANESFRRWFGLDLRSRDLNYIAELWEQSNERWQEAVDTVREVYHNSLTRELFREPMVTEIETDKVRTVEIISIPLLIKAKHTKERVLVIHDVSSQREAEHTQEALRQSQKMEAVGRLAGGVAHDFNNLLMVIINLASTLAEHLGDRAELREDVQEILDAGNRAADLTRQLLVFSRQQDLQPKVIDLSEVVAGTQKMLDRLIGEDIAVEIIRSKTPVCVLADQGQLEQVLVNLIVNARDAMPGGGQIVIETQVEKNTDSGSNSDALLCVRDNGSGMEADTVAHIFEPFYTTKEEGEGTGLGLSTVYGIVKNAGGDIEVESKPGEGTEFRLSFPEVTTHAAYKLKDKQSHSRGKGEQILVVEDSDKVRRVVVRILEKGGYQVLAAESPVRAIELARAQGQNLNMLISDMVMPQMNGLQLRSAIQILHPSIKVLFMSGYAGTVLEKYRTVLSKEEFIAKPFTPQKLLEKVRQVIEG